jgi:dienelactone hydrolase
MDHLGIRQSMVMGFCIGGPFIWSLLKRAPTRIVAAVLAQPSRFRPEMPDLLPEQHKGVGVRRSSNAGSQSQWRWSIPS